MSALGVPVKPPQPDWDEGWAQLAIAALGAAAVFSLLVAAAKVSGPWAPGGAFAWMPRALALHVNLAVLVWCLAMGCAMWGAQGANRLAALAGRILAIAGAALMTAAAFARGGIPVTSNYVPVIDSPLFLCGLASFAAGVGVSVALALWQARHRARRGVFHYALVPVVLAALSLGFSHAALPDMGAHPRFELLFWGPGHLLQFTYALLMMAAWTRLARAAGAAVDISRPMVRACFVIALAPAFAAMLIHAAYPPGSAEFRSEFTRLMGLGCWPGSVLLALLLVRCMRADGAPSSWNSPAGLSLGISMLLFFAGIAAGTLVRADTLTVPAHYHGTVGAVTAAFMGVVLDLAGAARARAGRPARISLWCYGAGTGLFMTGMLWAGAAGAPRKIPFGAADPATGVALVAVGAAVAVLGVLLFVVSAWRSPIGRWRELVQDSVRLERRGAVRMSDGRRAAVALTSVGVLALGAAIAWLPGPNAVRTTVPAAPQAGDVAGGAGPHAAEVHQRFFQGVAMLHAKQYEHAVTAFHRVLELEPAMPEAHANMGFALLGLQRYRAARDFFDSAAALRPQQVNAYFGLAVALEGMHDLAGALGSMRTYVHLARADDPYRRRAEAAVWEWQSALEQERSAAPQRAAARDLPHTP